MTINKCSTRYCKLVNSLGHYQLRNYTYGIPASETDFTQDIWFDDSDGRFGWNWNRPNPKPLDPSCVGTKCIGASFPFMFVGQGHWFDPKANTWAFLPKKISTINKCAFDVGYRYTKNPTMESMFDLTYDIWLDDSHGVTTIEIMIMLDCITKNTFCSPGKYLGVFHDTDNNHNYRVYTVDRKETYGTWKMYIFVLEDATTGNNLANSRLYTINFRSMMDFCISQGSQLNDMYLRTIEFGSEIWGKGFGGLEVNRYIITLNDIVLKSVLECGVPVLRYDVR